MSDNVMDPTQNTGFGGGTGNGMGSYSASKFPNPFFDIASEYIPRDLKLIFEFCEFVYLSYGTYRSAARKVVRYFLTELVLDGESEEEREEYKTFLNEELHLLNILSDIGDDYMVYGNAFVSIYFPFDRFLICPKCKTEYHCETIRSKLDMANLEFTAECPSKTCGYVGAFRRDDRRSLDRTRLRIKRWNPKLIRLRYHEISGEIDYFMEIEPLFLQRIRDNKPFYVNRCPWEVIECIAKSGKGEPPLFHFDPGSIYHLKEVTLSGLPIRGWGIPPIMPNFKLIYYIQILRRYDEAIAFDFIVPHRIIYPDMPPTQNGDALQTTSMSLFANHMQNMIKQHRKDPTSIQAAPFKIGYQMIGGEGKTLSPRDNIALAMDELLNAVGFPAELYKGTLQIQAFPVALRLFEKTWGQLVDGNNDLIKWIIGRISKHFGWGSITGSLRSVTLADDIERKQLMVQAAAGQDISKGTAYRGFGLEFMEEQRKVVDEQKKVQELQQEAMEEAQMSQLQDQAGTGGGGAPGGQAGATPGDVSEQGKQIAYQLVTQTPESLRRGELIKIKQSNPTLHAIVLQSMDELRGELGRQGQAAMLEQAKQGGGAMKSAAAKAAALEDLKQLPSPLRLALLIADQVMDVDRPAMRKIALDSGRGIKGANEALLFVMRKQNGTI